MKKNPWVIIAVVQFFVIMSLMSCSNNPLGVQEAGADPQQSPIMADKVMVNLSKTNMRDGTKTDEEISLQDYVNQTQPDIADFLPGKTWTVKYYIDGAEKVGHITFNADETFTCDDNMGYIIDRYWTLPDDCVWTPIKYTIINNTVQFNYSEYNPVSGKTYILYSYIDFSDIKTDCLKILPAEKRSAAILTPQE